MRLTRLLTASALLLAATVAAAPQAGRALQIEDYYRIKSVGGAQISPDGRWVVFNVSQRLEDDPAQKRENQSTTQTFVVETTGVSAPPGASGVEPRHVQHEGREVSNTRWTDDNWLQYAAGPQVFKVPPSGGTPTAVE